MMALAHTEIVAILDPAQSRVDFCWTWQYQSGPAV